jgi:(5-formylfuran-3-yl)methyl phosphate synthase
MTLMLASVAHAAEAALVLEGGADIIDFADPTQGPLGAVPVDTIRKGVEAIGGRRRISAALGPPPVEAGAFAAQVRALAAAGVDQLRIAADVGALERLEPAFSALASEIGVVGMLFADRAPDFDVLARMASIGFRGAFLDVAETSGKRLLDVLAPPQLQAFCALCRRHGLASGLAGLLQAPDVPRLLLLEPGVLGFRSALCARGRRGGPLDAKRIALVRDLIPADGATGESWSTGGAGARNDAFDAVFIRDFVTTADIGAYVHERGRQQRVRFDVEASVRRVDAHADDMRAIFSYDVILDAIRIVTGRGHIDFLERFAEDVAALVLKHPRVASVRVRVEKLDVVAGAIGVEIRRGPPKPPVRHGRR